MFDFQNILRDMDPETRKLLEKESKKLLDIENSAPGAMKLADNLAENLSEAQKALKDIAPLILLITSSACNGNDARSSFALILLGQYVAMSSYMTFARMQQGRLPNVDELTKVAKIQRDSTAIMVNMSIEHAHQQEQGSSG